MCVLMQCLFVCKCMWSVWKVVCVCVWGGGGCLHEFCVLDHITVYDTCRWICSDCDRLWGQGGGIEALVQVHWNTSRCSSDWQWQWNCHHWKQVLERNATHTLGQQSRLCKWFQYDSLSLQMLCTSVSDNFQIQYVAWNSSFMYWVSDGIALSSACVACTNVCTCTVLLLRENLHQAKVWAGFWLEYNYMCCRGSDNWWVLEVNQICTTVHTSCVICFSHYM